MNAAETYVQYFDYLANQSSHAHDFYGQDGPYGWAASFESLLFFRNAVRKIPIERPLVVDAGAGASTALLRLWFNSVVSVDPDPKYLELVELTCRHMAASKNLPSLARSMVSARSDYDALFYDYGMDQVRIDNFEPMAKKAKHIVYVDDCDFRPHAQPLRRHVLYVAQKHNWNTTDCLDACDEYGRWGILITKP